MEMEFLKTWSVHEGNLIICSMRKNFLFLFIDCLTFFDILVWILSLKNLIRLGNEVRKLRFRRPQLCTVTIRLSWFSEVEINKYY